jgi:tetratricopeptide (TPR) repeat protein
MMGKGDSGRAGWRGEWWKQADQADRIAQIGTWMMVLGTVRLICAFGESLGALIEMSRGAMPSLQVLSVFLQRNPPMVVIAMAWPLVLGLVLRRTRSPVFVAAAAATFLMLSIVGLVTLLSSLCYKTELNLLVGSFTVSRWSLARHQPAAVGRALLGLVQLALELATGILACGCTSSAGAGTAQPREPASPRRRLYGRLAVYLTLAFLVLSTRHLAWSTYVAVLDESSLFRQFVLQGDQPRRASASYEMMQVEVPSRRLGMRMAMELNNAYYLTMDDRSAEAKDRYLKVIEEIETSRREGDYSDTLELTLAQALNNLGWLLATSEDARMLRPADSVSYASRAVKLAPGQGNYWNTLGVAYYRMADWDQATRALERSMELRAAGQGDAYDWFFLAMIHAKNGRKDEALAWYRKAVTWAQGQGEGNPELYRFHVEAAVQLGLEKPPAPRLARARGEQGQRLPVGPARRLPMPGL